MARFPSREWMQAYSEALAAHPEAEAVAEALDGVYRFVVEPAGPVTERGVYDLEVRPGDPPHIAPIEPANGREPDLTLRADYRRWRELIRGEADPAMAVLFGRLKISGGLRAVRGRLDSARPLVDAIRSVETEWPDG